MARAILERFDKTAGRQNADRIRIAIDDITRRARGVPWVYDEHFEVRHGTWGGVLRLYDDAGRLLGENHGLAHGATTHPTIELRTSSFSGSRMGKPYNASALRQMAAAWPQVRQLIAEARNAYIAADRGPLDRTEALTLARIVTAYPAFLMRRAPQPLADRQIPETIAAAFKVMAGVHSTFEHMFEREGPEGLSLFETVSPSDLYDYIEAEGLFISGEGRACGGPERLVRETLRVAIVGDTPPMDPAAAQDPHTLRTLVRYGRAISAIEITLMLARDLENQPSSASRTDRYRRQLIEAAARAAGDDGVAAQLWPVLETGAPVAHRSTAVAAGQRERPARAAHRATVVAALERLERRARAALDRPAPSTPLDWTTVAGRLGLDLD